MDLFNHNKEGPPCRQVTKIHPFALCSTLQMWFFTNRLQKFQVLYHPRMVAASPSKHKPLLHGSIGRHIKETTSGLHN